MKTIELARELRKWLGVMGVIPLLAMSSSRLMVTSEVKGLRCYERVMDDDL